VAYPLSFDQPGAPTYFLDDDTGWDPGGPDQNDHAQPGLLQCGGEMRSIFCCYPLCIPPRRLTGARTRAGLLAACYGGCVEPGGR
jgi:hypothetical protein